MKECLLLICLIMLSLLENTAPHVLQVVNFMVITDEMETNRQKPLFIIYIYYTQIALFQHIIYTHSI
jgi:hypothetical protein